MLLKWVESICSTFIKPTHTHKPYIKMYLFEMVFVVIGICNKIHGF